MILLECFIGLLQGLLKIVSLIVTKRPWPSWTVMLWFACLLTPTVLWSDYETWSCLLGLPISTTTNLNMWSSLDLLSTFEESGRHCKIYPRFLFLMWVLYFFIATDVFIWLEAFTTRWFRPIQILSHISILTCSDIIILRDDPYLYCT